MDKPHRPQMTSVADEWRTNWLSRATWWWIGPLLRLGFSRPLQMEDLGALDPQDESALLADQMASSLSKEPVNIPYVKRLWRVLFAFDWQLMLIAGIGKLLGDLLGFLGPLALAGIINFCQLRLNGQQDEVWPAPGMPGAMEKGYWWMIVALVSAVLQNLFLHQHHHYVIRAGMHVRSALTVLVYRKAMVIKPRARAKFGSGFIQNAASVDANGVGLIYWYAHYAWAAPLQLAICMAMLYSQLGPSAFVGLAVLLALVPVQATLGARIGAAAKKTMTYSDTRVKLINEIISGIRILKFMAWESSFAGRVGDARSKEVHHKRTVAAITALNSSLLEIGPLLVALLSFLTYGYTAGEPLTAARAFTALSLFSILRLPLMVFPMLVGVLASSRVAADRLASFLDAPEQVEYRTLIPSMPPIRLQLRAARVKRAASSGEAADAVHDAGTAEAAVVPRTVEFANASLDWEGAVAGGKADTAKPTSSTSSTPFTLRNLNLVIPTGKLTTVVGQVGAGKSSLLAAMLGEMNHVAGNVTVRLPPGASASETHIAYCGQQPWIVNASVRHNITFGQELDEARYNAAIRVCALEPDLAMLPAGDDTEIGERGVNLSGGQKARIALARAVYSTCPLVLLDDVLSAVDAHVAAHLWTHALTGPDGLAGRTVVLVSHQLQFLARSDLVVVMAEGRIAQVGTYTELMAEGGAEAEGQRKEDKVDAGKGAEEGTSVSSSETAAPGAIKVTVQDGQATPTPPTPQSPSPARSPANLLAAMMAERRKVDAELSAAHQGSAASKVEDGGEQSGAKQAGNKGPTKAVTSPTPTSPASPSTTKPTSAAVSTSKTMTDEDRAMGTVPTSVYMHYLRAMGGPALGIILTTLAASNATRIGTDWWLGLWSTDALGQSVGYYVGVYAGITAASSVLTLAMGIAWAVGGLKAATTLHNAMFARVLRSPVSFFDTTPTGRILNRFSSDIATVDKDLPSSFSTFTKLLISVVGTIIVQAIILPWTLLAAGPVAILFIMVQTFFRASAREVKRMDAISKSPVFAHLAESLVGLPSIRAYGVTRTFIHTAESRIDTNNIANWKSNLMNRWLGLRLDALGALLVGGVCLVAVLTAGQVNAGLIGLAITYSMSVTGTLNWLVRSGSETETYLASVERIGTYSSLPTEAAPVVHDNRPAATWPSKGAVSFNNISMRYRPGLPQVLSRVSVEVQGGHKVGVCGRTGSGKSTLMLALFRIVEPCQDDKGEDGVGHISIDGVNIHSLGLDDLRSRLAVIPQDPTLFTGTVRYNLDPTEEIKDDGLLWEVLRKAALEDVVKGMGGLDATVAEGGSNLSVGQRQLVCLARALMRRSRILVLDEATASVDVQTDSLIQTMLRSAFAQSTAFIIAHRINTILDCDRVLVLDGGRVAEYGAPGDLLKTEGSLFGQLVKSSAERAAGDAD